MSRDSAKAHYAKQPGDPDEGFITASDAQAAIDDIYDDMSAPAVIADGSVTSGKIAADAVGSAQIATGAVGSGELATDAVTSDKIADGAVSNAHVASDAAIAASKVAGTAVTQADTGTVTNGMLAGSIAKTKVAGTAITAADTGTVTGTMIGTGEVGNGNLAANAVNEAKIASGAVTTVKIEDDAVTTAKIAADAVTSAEIAANAVGASELADNAVDTAAIAADAVTADKIANDTITAAELAANSVGTSELANDSVTAAKILDGTITANEIQNASITGAKLVNDTITATQIAADAIGSSELANNAVDTAAVADSAITTAKIADGAVTPAKLARQPGNLLSENIAGGTDELSATTGFGSAYQCTLSSTTARFVQGSRSLRLTLTASSGGYAAWTPLGTSGVPVTPGQTYTATAQAYATGTANSYITLRWYDSGGSVVSNVSSATSSTINAWVTHTVTAVAPGTAAYASVAVTGSAGTTGDTIDWDALGFWRGAGGKWQLPGIPIPGQSEIAVNDAVNLSGTGSPEGVVTAAPGSTWLQIGDAITVSGNLSWRKATGTGNTGWVAEGALADTGLRNIASIIDADWAPHASGGYLSLCRIGQTVTLVGRLERVTASGTRSDMDPVVTVPTGFVPQSAYRAIGQAVYYVSAAAANIGYLGDVASAARMDVIIPSGGTWATGDDVFIQASWITDDAWPASLPGSAA